VDAEESDFESWAPLNQKGSTCLMGHQVSYVRRKQKSECFNGVAYERKQFVKNCECTEKDYECDMDYHRSKGFQGDCVPAAHLDKVAAKVPPSHCPDHWYETKGYRLVAGDTCEGGVDHMPIKHSCPHWLRVGKTGMSVLGVFSFLLCCMCMSVMAMRSDKMQEMMMAGGNTGYSRVGNERGMPNSMIDEDDFGLDDEDDAPMLSKEDISMRATPKISPLDAARKAGGTVPKIAGPPSDSFSPRGT
jgi:hypothetical protein